VTDEPIEAALPTPRSSPVYTPAVIEEIQEKAVLGRYRIRGFGTLRARPLPSLDDLTGSSAGRRPCSGRASPSSRSSSRSP
jgi:hypothetical protein